MAIEQRYLDDSLFVTAPFTSRGRIIPIIAYNPSTNQPVGGVSPNIKPLIGKNKIQPVVAINPLTGDAT